MQLTIYFFMWIVFIGGLEQEHFSSLSHELKNTSIETNQNSTCRLLDSLVLVDLYYSANGPGWSNPWNLNSTMDNWDGVILNSDGCLDELRLSNRDLDGTVPGSIGNLSEITLLHLDNNNLQGQIPGEIGNLSDLKTLFLDNNNFTGTIPTQLGNITSLNTLFIDNNLLTGGIPISFLGLNNLTNLEFFGNKIDSVPDLTPIMTLIIQNNKLKMFNNALTFDDILPNMSSSLGDHYHPQDSVFQEITYYLSTGDAFSINLEIDEGISNSSYQWYKDGLLFGAPLTTSKLPLSPVDWDDAGVYHCQITNPDAPLLTLYSRPITIQVSCGISYGNLDGTYCDDQDFWINGNLYNQSNPTGSEYINMPDQYGCDSILNINLTFLSNASSSFQQAICNNEFYVINGVTYDINNLTGTETLSNSAYNGCDSIVTINLTAAPPAEHYINDIICNTDAIVVNGTPYNSNNPDGVETLPSQNYLGCDSVIYINLDFHPLAEGWYNQELCSGGSFILGNILFDESNPSGTVTLENESFRNCDSIVYVNLTFADAISEDYAPTLCLGETRIINGVTYDSNNPTGTEFFPQGSYIGCDSVVNVDLSFHGVSQGFINETLCEEEFVIVDGITFDFFNRSGAVILYDQSFYGCDSTVFINLSFTTKQEIYLDELLCPGESRQINGVTYDVNNPTGETTLPAQVFEHCDSTLYINLTYVPLAEGFINENKCEGEVVIVDGVTFDINNPTGAVALNGQGFNGCDSTVYVNLVFEESSEGFVNELLCNGETRVVNGVTYDISNPTGVEYFPSQNQYGCDSTVYINLTYVPVAENFISNTLCNGTTLLINGVTYNESNPSGTEMLPGMGYNGCDSTIFVDLTFTDMVVNEQTELLCTGASIVVNGVTYDANNSTGTETFPMGSYIGCDSIVEVNLSFYESPMNYLNPILCGDDFVEVNGTVYNQTNLTGIETLAGAAYLGCDSIVEINLSYQEAIPSQLTPTICNNHFYTFNGVIYDIDNPTGTEIFPGLAYNGCDSIVEISLNFHESIIGNYNPSTCADGSVVFNGTTYDMSNPSGTETLVGLSYNGCDSIVEVFVNFIQPIIGEYNPSTCTNGSVLFNGTTYDMSNPSGTEILADQSYLGCDSTVNVQVSFVESIEETRNDDLCPGEFISVNGTIYDFDNANGSETMASINGCDSIVTINLSFNDNSTADFIQNICPDEEIIINGNTYSASNLSGTEILSNASFSGCDSIINIDLNLLSASNTFYNQTLCEGQIVELHGQVFNVDNPFGIIELDVPNFLGCDSLLIVELTFNPSSIGDITQTLCEDETLEINGTTYGLNNPTGTETLVQANYLGCDSIININLSFSTPTTGLFNQQLCSGENIVINGTLYDATNATGTEILENANYLGCDSLLEVNLQFVDATIGNIEETICAGDDFIFDGQNIVTPGSYTLTIPNGSFMGCDSIVNLTLNVVDATSSSMEATICEGETFLFDGQNISTTGNYTQTIENGNFIGCDSIITLTLNVQDATQLGMAAAGMDEILCDNEVTLNANLPTGTTGIWTTTSPITISEPANPSLLLENIPIGTHEMTWTLSSSLCGEYSSDVLLLSVPDLPIANEDNYDVIGNDGSENVLEIMSNDTMEPSQNTSINILSSPASGSASSLIDGTIEYIADPTFTGTVEIEYEICDEFCPDNCSTSFITINVSQMPTNVTIPNIPNAITANDDGINDEWIIDVLEQHPEDYPDNKLVIINRWGEPVFEASPYLNNWNGSDQQGLPLPTGTYYYTLILDLGDGEIFKGDLTILR